MINNIRNIDFPKFFLLIASLIIMYSVYVRIEGIGYSNFQGDEVNTIDFLYEMNDGVLNYLLSQKRGPVQYVINILNVSLFGYQNEFQIRVVYSVAAILSLLTFYLFVRKIFDTKTAFITSLLLSINGLFIAFARITQYQAIMYTIIPIGVLVFTKAVKEKSRKLFVISGLIMTFSLLTHYDTLSVMPYFIAVSIAVIVNEYIKNAKDKSIGSIFKNNNIKTFLINISIFFTVFFIPALAYYIPFSMGQSFNDTTSEYLGNRLFGGGFMPRTELTLKLITMYIPKFHIQFLFVCGLIAIIFNYSKFSSFKFNKFKISTKTIRTIFISFVVLLLLASIFSLYPIKPRSASLLVIISSIIISILMLLNKNIDMFRKAVMIWFLGAYCFYFYIMKDPRTHVYVSFIPLFMIAGSGVVKFIDYAKNNILKNLLYVLLLTSILFVSSVNYLIFVDRNPEYPWFDKSILGFDIYRLKRVRHEKIDGVFGFNNYRGWEQIAGMLNKGCLIGNFKSNEKDSITYFYTRNHQVPDVSDFAITKETNNVVIVEGPHSWIYVTPKAPDNFVLLKTIYSGDYPVSYIYGRSELYPNSKLLCDESTLVPNKSNAN